LPLPKSGAFAKRFAQAAMAVTATAVLRPNSAMVNAAQAVLQSDTEMLNEFSATTLRADPLLAPG